jgi:hypothetical protein
MLLCSEWCVGLVVVKGTWLLLLFLVSNEMPSQGEAASSISMPRLLVIHHVGSSVVSFHLYFSLWPRTPSLLWPLFHIITPVKSVVVKKDFGRPAEQSSVSQQQTTSTPTTSFQACPNEYLNTSALLVFFKRTTCPKQSCCSFF